MHTESIHSVCRGHSRDDRFKPEPRTLYVLNGWLEAGARSQGFLYDSYTVWGAGHAPGPPVHDVSELS